MSRCVPPCAAQDLSSFYIVWATGHVTEASPDLPTTTNPYNVNPLNKSAPGALLYCCRAQIWIWIWVRARVSVRVTIRVSDQRLPPASHRLGEHHGA